MSSANGVDTLRASPRVSVLRPGEPNLDGRCVLYWIQRAPRASDNPALDTAIELGNALGKPVVAFFAPRPGYPNANLRHYRFLVDGVAELAGALRARGVSLVLRRFPDHSVARLAAELGACLVVGDDNPLRELRAWRRRAAEQLDVPLWIVDADVVVPTSLLAKEPYAARTIRPRIHARLEEFLVASREPVARVRAALPEHVATVDPAADLLEGMPIDRSLGPVAQMRGGTSAGLAALERFVSERVRGYDQQRNSPEARGTSELSPYLHFGHLGPVQVALAVRRSRAPSRDKDAFLEQLIVRRELAIGFVALNDRYDSLAGCEPWARRTLDAHRADRREPVYDERTLEQGTTHDQLWNAAQRQMTHGGWMHGYLRMYWAKMLLAWSATPEDAFGRAVRLNDRYQLDGRDPNGYAGIAWAIGGKHDRAWGPERPVFGTVRIMTFGGMARKTDWRAYVREVQTLTGEEVPS